MRGERPKASGVRVEEEGRRAWARVKARAWEGRRGTGGWKMGTESWGRGAGARRREEGGPEEGPGPCGRRGDRKREGRGKGEARGEGAEGRGAGGQGLRERPWAVACWR